MKLKWLIIINLFFILFSLSAHRVSISWAYAEVKQNEVELSFEILPEDFIYFYGLKPNAQGFVSEKQFNSCLQAHSKRLLEGFFVLSPEGTPLKGEVKSIKSSLLGIRTLKGLDFRKLIGTTVQFKVVYPYQNRPDSLTFSQMLTPLQMNIPSVVELTVAQKGFLPDQEISLSNDATVHVSFFDWNRKRLPFESQEQERKRYEAAKKKKQLGIIRYNDIYAFFYSEKDRIRLELIMPLVLLESFLTIPRENPLFLSVSEQQAFQPALVDFIKSRVEIKANEVVIPAELRRCDYYSFDLSDFATVPEKKQQTFVTTRVGLMFDFNSESIIEKGGILWNLFNSTINTTGALIFSANESKRYIFSPYKPEYRWIQSELGKNPRESITHYLDKSITKINQSELSQITQQLLDTVYHAYDYSSDEHVYDLLSLVVADEMIEKLFFSVRESLKVRKESNLTVKVEKVTLQSLDAIKRVKKERSVQFRVKWEMSGTVEHWGHLHRRINQYQANMKIIATDSGWLISSIDMIEAIALSREVLVREALYE